MIDYYTMWVHQIKTPIFAMRLLLTDTPSQKDQAIAGELFKIEQYADMVLSYLRLDSHYNDLVIRRQPLDDILKQARPQICAFIYPKENFFRLSTDQRCHFNR